MAQTILYSFLVFQVLGISVSNGQTENFGAPAKGVVWEPPVPFAELREDLNAISAHGANAVRLPLVLESNLHVAADFFGVTLFQELDARFLPAQRIVEQRERLTAQIDSAIEVASKAEGRHRFGLGYWVDTSVPSSCGVLEALSERVHRRISNAETYYVSAFVESDVCSHAVDFVLLDADATSAGIDLDTDPSIHPSFRPGCSRASSPGCSRTATSRQSSSNDGAPGVRETIRGPHKSQIQES